MAQPKPGLNVSGNDPDDKREVGSTAETKPVTEKSPTALETLKQVTADETEKVSLSLAGEIEEDIETGKVASKPGDANTTLAAGFADDKQFEFLFGENAKEENGEKKTKAPTDSTADNTTEKLALGAGAVAALSMWALFRRNDPADTSERMQAFRKSLDKDASPEEIFTLKEVVRNAVVNGDATTLSQFVRAANEGGRFMGGSPQMTAIKDALKEVNVDASWTDYANSSSTKSEKAVLTLKVNGSEREAKIWSNGQIDTLDRGANTVDNGDTRAIKEIAEAASEQFKKNDIAANRDKKFAELSGGASDTRPPAEYPVEKTEPGKTEPEKPETEAKETKNYRAINRDVKQALIQECRDLANGRWKEIIKKGLPEHYEAGRKEAARLLTKVAEDAARKYGLTTREPTGPQDKPPTVVTGITLGVTRIPDAGGNYLNGRINIDIATENPANVVEHEVRHFQESLDRTAVKAAMQKLGEQGKVDPKLFDKMILDDCLKQVGQGGSRREGISVWNRPQYSDPQAVSDMKTLLREFVQSEDRSNSNRGDITKWLETRGVPDSLMKEFGTTRNVVLEMSGELHHFHAVQAGAAIPDMMLSLEAKQYVLRRSAQFEKSEDIRNQPEVAKVMRSLSNDSVGRADKSYYQFSVEEIRARRFQLSQELTRALEPFGESGRVQDHLKEQIKIGNAQERLLKTLDKIAEGDPDGKLMQDAREQAKKLLPSMMNGTDAEKKSIQYMIGMNLLSAEDLKNTPYANIELDLLTEAVKQQRTELKAGIEAAQIDATFGALNDFKAGKIPNDIVGTPKELEKGVLEYKLKQPVKFALSPDRTAEVHSIMATKDGSFSLQMTLPEGSPPLTGMENAKTLIPVLRHLKDKAGEEGQPPGTDGKPHSREEVVRLIADYLNKQEQLAPTEIPLKSRTGNFDLSLVKEPLVAPADQSSWPGQSRTLKERGYLPSTDRLLPGAQFTEQCLDKTSGKVVDRVPTIVDVANDPVLKEVIADCIKKYSNISDPAQKMEMITKHVNGLFASETKPPVDWKPRFDGDKYDANSGMDAVDREFRGQKLYLGEYVRRGVGSSNTQALLVKAVGDHMGLDIGLESGKHAGNRHMWNTLRLPTGAEQHYDATNGRFKGISQSSLVAEYEVKPRQSTSLRAQLFGGGGGVSERTLPEAAWNKHNTTDGGAKSSNEKTTAFTADQRKVLDIVKSTGLDLTDGNGVARPRVVQTLMEGLLAEDGPDKLPAAERALLEKLLADYKEKPETRSNVHEFFGMKNDAATTSALAGKDVPKPGVTDGTKPGADLSSKRAENVLALGKIENKEEHARVAKEIKTKAIVSDTLKARGMDAKEAARIENDLLSSDEATKERAAREIDAFYETRIAAETKAAAPGTELGKEKIAERKTGRGFAEFAKESKGRLGALTIVVAAGLPLIFHRQLVDEGTYSGTTFTK